MCRLPLWCLKNPTKWVRSVTYVIMDLVVRDHFYEYEQWLLARKHLKSSVPPAVITYRTPFMVVPVFRSGATLLSFASIFPSYFRQPLAMHRIVHFSTPCTSCCTWACINASYGATNCEVLYCLCFVSFWRKEFKLKLMCFPSLRMSVHELFF